MKLRALGAVMLVAFGAAVLTAPDTATAAAAVAGPADKELVAAARAGDVDRVRGLLAQGADPNALDRITPLMAAATALQGKAEYQAKAEKRMDLMRVLLAAGARVNARADSGETALTFAARFRDVDAINLLLDNGADPNLVAKTGISPLLEAMWFGAGEKKDLEMMQPLLARGADPNARGEWLGTPLSLAVQHRSVAMVKLLLDRGADPNLPDHTDATPLMLAVSRRYLGPDTVTIVQLLVDAGADVNARGPFGDTPASIAASTDNQTMLPLLARLGAKDATVDPTSRQPSLIQEVRAGHLAEVRVMLASGADPNVTDARNWTPLHDAAYGGNAQIVEALLSAGARVNVPSKKGWTPLGLAVRAQHTRIVLRLLAAGAEATGSNGAGEPLIVNASRVKFRSSEPEIVRALLDAGAEPDARDRDGLTPLMWAAAVGPPDVVALLLRRGADPNATTRDGITAWQVAIGEDVIAMLRQGRGARRASPAGR